MDTIDNNLVDSGEYNQFLPHESILALEQGSKWATMLAIIGYISCGFMIIIGIVMFFASFAMKNMSGIEGMPTYLSGLYIGLGIFYILLGILFFLPMHQLYKFCSSIKRAIITNGTADINQAFISLKNHYKIMGIITIVLISLYIIGIVAMFVGGATMFSNMNEFNDF